MSNFLNLRIWLVLIKMQNCHSFFIIVSENAHLIFINLNLWRQFKMKLNMFYRCIKITGIFKPLNFNQCKFCWYTWRCTNFWFSIWFKKNIHQCTLLKCEQVVMTVNGQCPLIPPKPLSLHSRYVSLVSLVTIMEIKHNALNTEVYMELMLKTLTQCLFVNNLLHCLFVFETQKATKY